MEKELTYNTVIVGAGVSGLYAALKLPKEQNILLICKEDLPSCDSMLAQGGICVQRDETDYDSFFEDTLKAGHYENRKESVDIMIRNSRAVINDLLALGVRFDKEADGSLKYTREGAHAKPRICFHKDITGKEITETLLRNVQALPNVTIMDYTVMEDLLVEGNTCHGIVAKAENGDILRIHAENTILATGGIGGLYEHSTNFPSLTGDALRLAEKYGVELIGAKPDVIDKAEDRQRFKEAMEKIGLESARSGIAYSMAEALEVQQRVGFPAVIRPSFTLGGSGGGIAYNMQEFVEICEVWRFRPPMSCSLKSLSWAGKSTRWKSCATRPTTASSSARSRTSTRWVFTRATRSRWRRLRRLRIASTNCCATLPLPCCAKSAWTRAAPMCSLR